VNIDPTNRIGGAPVVKVRDALRRFRYSSFGPDGLAAYLVGTGGAAEVMAGLLEAGYVEPTDGGRHVELTQAGVRFTNASARPPVRRAVAERHLAAFLERVEAVNADDDLLYVVERVTLFGSMLDPSAAKVSDVDLCVELRPRYPEDHSARSRARVEAAAAGGRRFPNLTEQLFWPQREVELVLKARSPVLSVGIGPEDTVIPEGEPRRAIYQR